MGVDYRAVCFIGWEVLPESEDKEPSPHGNGSADADFVEELAGRHGLEWDRYGDGCYGGEDFYMIGYALHSQTLSQLEAVIAKLKKHSLSSELGQPRVWSGVHMY